jgi:hypothetical protein
MMIIKMNGNQDAQALAMLGDEFECSKIMNVGPGDDELICVTEDGNIGIPLKWIAEITAVT